MPLVTLEYDLWLKKTPLCSVLKSSKICACGPIVDRKLYKPTTPPSSNTDAQMACLMISILTGCQYIFYYSKAWDWNWESRVACFYTNYQSFSSQNECRDDAWHYRLIDVIYIIRKLICMSPWTVGEVAKVYPYLESPWIMTCCGVSTNLTNCTHSGKVTL